MALNFKNEVKKGDIIILVIPNEQYTKKIVEVAKYFSDNHKAICYVSLNKLFDALISSLTKSRVNVDKFFFIDAITKSANPNAKEPKNCICVSSSSALTELIIAIDKVLGTGKFDGFLFDSISTLLIYNASGTVSRFVHSLVNKIKSSKTTAIFTSLEGDTKSSLLKEVGMYADNILHYK